MDSIFSQVLNMSLTASVIILCVLLARLLLKRAPKIYSYALWAVVLFRLLCPVSLTAPVSVLEITEPETTQSGVTSTITYIPAEYVYRDAEPETTPVSTPEQTAQKPDTSNHNFTVFTAAAYIWLAGLAVMALHSAVSYAQLRRRLIGAVRCREGLYLADHIQSPFVLGIFRPRIYLPSDTPMQERPYIIAHERHHIRRLDHIVKLLAYAALCIHWFNPLVWVAFLLAGKDMEMSCDEAVVKKLGAHIRADYSASLLRLATGRKTIAGTPLAFGEGDTKGRVKNMARWKKPSLWVSILCALLCIVIALVCALNPEKTEEPEPRLADFHLTLPEGFDSETRKDGSVLFTENNRTVGGLSVYDTPDFDLIFDSKYEMSQWNAEEWVDALGIPQTSEEILSQMVSVSQYCDLEVSRGSANPPVEVSEMHYLYIHEDVVYDLWFDHLCMDWAVEEEILNSVSIQSQEEKAQPNGYNLTLPTGYTTSTDENGDLIFLKEIDGETQTVGGLMLREAPAEPLDLALNEYRPSNAHEWMQALGIPEASDESLAYMGGNGAFADYEIEYWSDVAGVENITFFEEQYFFIQYGDADTDEAGNISRREEYVYILWFDEMLVSQEEYRPIGETLTFGDFPSTVSIVSGEELARKPSEDEAFQMCSAVFDAVQSGSYQITSTQKKQGFEGPSGAASTYSYHDGNWLKVTQILTEGENVTEAGNYYNRQAWLSVNGQTFSNEGHWGESGDLLWAEDQRTDFEAITAPKLASLVWVRSIVTYMDTLVDENGISIMYRVDKKYEDREDYLDYYFVSFSFDNDGNFVDAYFQINAAMDNAYTVTESITTLDPQTIATEIDREYYNASGAHVDIPASARSSAYYQDDFRSDDGTVSVLVGVAGVQEVKTLPTLTARNRIPTGQEAQMIGQAIFGEEARFHAQEPREEKDKYDAEELQKRIDRWSNYTTAEACDALWGYREGRGQENAQLVQSFIENYQTMLLTAPADIPAPDCDWTFRDRAYYNSTEVSEADLWGVDVIDAVVEKDGLTYSYSVTINGKDKVPYSTFAAYFNTGISPNMIDERLFEAKLCRVERPSQTQVNAIQSKAAEMLENMNMGQWALEKCYIDAAEYTINAEGDTETEYSVVITAVPLLEGQPAGTFYKSDILTWGSTHKACFRFAPGGELLEFRMSQPVELKEVTSEADAVLTADALLEKATAHLRTTTVADHGFVYDETGFVCNVEIKEASYGLTCLYTDETTDTITYVPTFTLRGNTTTMTEDGDIMETLRNVDILVLNATDGTYLYGDQNTP